MKVCQVATNIIVVEIVQSKLPAAYRISAKGCTILLEKQKADSYKKFPVRNHQF